MLASLFSAACFDLGSPARPDASPAPSADGDLGDLGGDLGGDLADLGLVDGTIADGGLFDTDATTMIDAETPPCVEGSVDPALATVMVDLVSLRVATAETHAAAGGVIAWVNMDTRTHRLVSGEPGAPLLPENGGFNTGAIPPGTTYAHRFCTLRTLTYYCSNHPGVMNGYRIVIE